jgi:hypothetical protein
MSGSNNFVITIGNYGAIVALHDKNKIKNKIFLEELNPENKQELSMLFAKNQAATMYILLDHANQIYKKKSYPAVKKSDLFNVIKRDMDQDEDKEGLKSYILLNKKISATRKWECLFVSSSDSEQTNDWIKFLLDMPNYLNGIYMLPVESFSLFNLMKSNIRLNSRIILKRNDLYCVILQNKVSGIRQIVFSETSIVFTRIVNYDFNSSDFLEKYEQDLYSTFEYLKRLFPELIMGELDIVNILSKETLEKIKKINNVELNFTNYTPFQAAAVAGFKNIIAENSSYCDLIISKVFSESKRKILKFDTKRMKLLRGIFYVFKFSKYLNILLLATICSIGLYIGFINKQLNELVASANRQRLEASSELQRVKLSEVDEKYSTDIDIDQIIDMGKVHEALNDIGINFIESYNKLSLLRKYNVFLTSLVYNVSGFTNKTANRNITYKIDLNGQIYNKSGDVEDLFKGFDGMIAATKQTFDKNQVNYTELPKNIDFAKKYYDSAVQITIEGQ